MSRLRPRDGDTETELPAVHACKGKVLAQKLLAYERTLTLGQGETVVSRELWMQFLKLAAEAAEEP